LYFNGDKYAVPPVAKHFVANQEVTSVTFSPRVINIVATVKAPSSVTAQAIANQLALVVRPEALKSDGVTYEWNFGGQVPVSRLGHEIFNTSPLIEDADIATPPADIVLGEAELPVIGTVTITVVEP
jgi:hypothetical protein